jgi:hypothetical protein
VVLQQHCCHQQQHAQVRPGRQPLLLLALPPLQAYLQQPSAQQLERRWLQQQL